jgi:hypothetical protein
MFANFEGKIYQSLEIGHSFCPFFDALDIFVGVLVFSILLRKRIKNSNSNKSISNWNIFFNFIRTATQQLFSHNGF